MPDTITITDDRTGKTVTVPITDGVFPSSALRELDPTLFMYDPAYLSTAACKSDDHLPRRRRRHPALPRLPDRAARRALDVPRGRLPPALRRAAQRDAAADVDATTSPTTRSSTRTCASGSSTGSTTTPTRWGCSSPPLAALGTFYLDAKDIFDDESRHKQILRLIAKAPTLAAMCHRFAAGLPFFLPDNSLSLPGQLPQHDVEDRRVRGPPDARAGDGRAVHPPRRPRAELRHDGDARRRLEPRRPLLGGRRRGVGAVRPAPRRRQRGGRADARRDRLDRRGAGVRRRRSRAARAG